MRILITNDDGIAAPGIEALWRAVRDLGEVTVVAPDSERSAVGHAITLAEPLRVSDYAGPGGLTGHAVSGTPADCVKIAVRAILAHPPDLVLSGINQGANMGTNLLYSGTVSAATEAAMLGLPAAAFSLADRHYRDFSAAAAYARRLAIEIGRRGLPRGISLNVNVPPSRPPRSAAPSRPARGACGCSSRSTGATTRGTVTTTGWSASGSRTRPRPVRGSTTRWSRPASSRSRRSTSTSPTRRCSPPSAGGIWTRELFPADRNL